MSLSFPRTPFQVIASEVRAAVGEYAWRQAVSQARRQGANLRQAIEAAVHRLSEGRQGPANYRNRKRDISGGIKPLKLNFEEPESSTMNGEDVNFTRSKLTVGGSRKRSANELFKAQIGGMEEIIYRWQACSANLLGPGRLPIGFGFDSTTFPTVNCLPFHMMSLTNNPGLPENAPLGCWLPGMFRYYFDKTSGNMGYAFLKSQAPNGNPTLPQAGYWSIEKGTSQAKTGQIFHKYTDIRLNLYGSTLYPLKYKVMLITDMPREMQPLENAAMTNPITVPGNDFTLLNNNPLSQFILDHVRPLVTNPIIGSNTDEDYKGKYKIVSQKTYNIPCLSYGNAVSEAGLGGAVSATNVHNVNMFIRHDRYRDYKWHQLATDIVRTNNPGGVGYDVTDTANVNTEDTMCDVDREQRLFLVISCNAGALENGTAYTATGIYCGPDADTTNPSQLSGSYDIVVRNCFRQLEEPIN
jgi:plasmid stabilization system protein ParE